MIKVSLKCAILGMCLFAAMDGKYPPVLAQQHEMSAEDATQDANITELNKHLENTDRNVSSLQSAGNSNALAIAEMQGEERVFFTILGILSGAGIVLQVKTKKTVAA